MPGAEDILISRDLEGAHVGSGPVPAVRRRAGTPLLRPARPGGGQRSRLRGRPRVRPGEPDRRPGRPVARRRGRRGGQLAGDDRCGPGGGREAGQAQLHARRHPGLAAGPQGRCARVQRRAAVGARPSGRGPALAGPARAGRVAGLPASRQLRPADARHPARPGPVGPLGATAGRRRAQPPGPRPRGVPGPAGPGRLLGGRLGDHLPARAAGRRSGGGVVPGHRAAPRPGRPRSRSGRAVRRRVRRAGGRGVPGGAVRDRPAVPPGVRGRAGRADRARGVTAPGGRGVSWPPWPRCSARVPAATARSRPG